MQANSRHLKLFQFHLSFCFWKLWKGREKGEKIQKCEYLKNEKSFLDEIKTFFIIFEELSFGEKNKNLIKSSGHKLSVLHKNLPFFQKLTPYRHFFKIKILPIERFFDSQS